MNIVEKIQNDTGLNLLDFEDFENLFDSVFSFNLFCFCNKKNIYTSFVYMLLIICKLPPNNNSLRIIRNYKKEDVFNEIIKYLKWTNLK